jgi:hypothetical protein
MAFGHLQLGFAGPHDALRRLRHLAGSARRAVLSAPAQ